MNFDIPYGGKERLLQPKIFPILILIKQWSLQGEAALMDTTTILYLLQILQAILCKHEDITLQSIMDKMRTVMSVENYESYIKSLESVGSNLLQYMELFSHLKKITSQEEGGDAPLVDDSNGVFGGFLKRCLHEYQRLTFSQMLYTQRQWSTYFNDRNMWNESLKIRKKSNRELLIEAKQNKDYTSALHKLILLHPHSNTPNISVELKSLHLAMLLAQFDHIDECRIALKEAIRLAQLSENTLVLEHSLGLLQRLSPVSPTTSRPLIMQLIKNAQEQKDNLLVSTAKLQLSKTELQLHSHPRQVLDAVQSSVFDVFDSYDQQNHKSAVQSSALLFNASVLRLYGLRYNAVLPLQLLCHMTSHDQGHTHHYKMDQAKAISFLAITLAEEGHLNDGILLLENALHRFNETKYDTKYLQQSLSELRMQRALQINDIHSSQKHLNEISVFDVNLAQYWTARKYFHCDLFCDAMRECDLQLTLMRSDKNKPLLKYNENVMKAKLLLLQTDILMKESQYSKSLDKSLQCLAHCKIHQLWDLANNTKLKIASAQLSLGLIEECRATVSELLPHVLVHGQSIEKAMLFLILAEANLMEEKNLFMKTKKFSSSAHESGLQYLQYSLAALNQCSPPSQLINVVLTLQELLHQDVKI